MNLPRQFLVFCAIGTLGFLVDVTVLYALAPLLGWLAGRIVSFLAAATATWWFNRRFTFAGDAALRGGQVASQYARYLLSMLGGAAVNYGAYAATLVLVAHPHAPALGVAIGSIAGLGINFLSARYLVFRRTVKRP
ncbi:MAG: GtrA family protein [Haliea sp.]|nr:MAG: GtrA family protein [Haliea sp.]